MTVPKSTYIKEEKRRGEEVPLLFIARFVATQDRKRLYLRRMKKEGGSSSWPATHLHQKKKDLVGDSLSGGRGKGRGGSSFLRNAHILATQHRGARMLRVRGEGTTCGRKIDSIRRGGDYSRNRRRRNFLVIGRAPLWEARRMLPRRPTWKGGRVLLPNKKSPT